MKKNFKRWLAFLLAVVLVATSGMFRSESFLQATDDQATGSPVAGEETQLTLNNTQDEITLPPADTAEKPVTEVPPVTTENPVTDVPPVATEKPEPTTENPVTEVPPVTTEEPSTETESTEASQEENPVVQPDADVPPVNEAATVSAANAAGPGEFVESTEEPESDPDEDDLEGQEPVGLSDEVPENVTVTVECKDDQGNVATESATLAFGMISADPCGKGTAYTYVGTMYQNVRISAITYGGQNADGQHIYLVTPESDADVSLEVVNPAEIKVVYSNQREVTVTYEYDESRAEILKTEKVMTGDPFSFSVQPKAGHQITGVIVTCDGQPVDVAKDGTVYSVDGASVKGEMQVTVTANVKEYRITFNGHDAEVKYNSKKYHNLNKSSKTETFVGKNTIDFEIDGTSNGSHYLNGFEIILTDDNGNKESITVTPPDDNETSTTTSVVVLKGTTVILKRNGGWGQHSVSISNSNGICADIEIAINYKEGTERRLSLHEVFGVEKILMFDGKTEMYFDSNMISNAGLLESFPFRYDEEITVYVKAKNNYYSNDTSKISVGLTNGGKPYDKVKSIVASDRNDFDYKIILDPLATWIPANHKKNVGMNISIAPKAIDFEVRYDYTGGKDANGSESFIDNTVYTTADGKNAVSLKEAPSRAGYEFVGWQYGDKIYRQSEIYKIDQKTIDLAKIENGKYICTFVAQWKEKEETASTDYQIKVSFEGVNTDPVVIRKSSEYKGTIRVTSSTIEAYLRNLKVNGTDEEKNKIPDNWETEYEIDRTVYTLNLNTDREIKVQFSQKAYPYKVVYEYYDQNGNFEKSETKKEENLKAGTAITESPVLTENYYVESAVAADAKGTQVQEEGFDKSSYVFAGTMVSGGLTITYKFRAKTELLVTVKSDTFTYDGKPHTVEGFEGYVDPDTGKKTLSVSVSGVAYTITGLTAQKTGTYVEDGGEVTASVDKAKVFVGDEDVTARCQIIVTPGTLTINPREIAFSITDTKQYNGLNQTFVMGNNEIIFDSEVLADGDSISVIDGSAIQGTDVGTYTGTPNVTIMRGDKDVTDNYKITATATLVIEKLLRGTAVGTVELKGWVYGNDHDEPVYEVVDDEDDPGNPAEYYKNVMPAFFYKSADKPDDSFSEIVPTDAGKYEVIAVWSPKNYEEISSEPCPFEISKRDVTIEAKKNPSYTYDALEHTVVFTKDDVAAKTELDGKGLVTGHNIAEFNGSIAGTVANTYTLGTDYSVKIKDKNGLDVTNNYNISAVGSMVIEKATADTFKNGVKLSITGWVYGETVNSPSYTITPGNDYGDPTYSYKKLGDAGIEDIVYTAEEFEALLYPDAGKYEVTAVWAATDNCESLTATAGFTISKRQITVAPVGGEKPFNGQEQTADSCTVTAGTLVSGHNVSAEFEGSQKLVNELWLLDNISIVKDSVRIQDKDENNVTDNYDIKTEKALLRVTADNVSPSAIISKIHTPKAGGYNVGDEVVFTISVTNMYNNYGERIDLTEIEGVDIDWSKWDELKWETFGPGQTKTITATYTITERDILNGKFVNVATAEYSIARGKDKVYQAEDEVQVAQPNAAISVTMVPEKTSGYDLNDEVKYIVTVTNTGNLTLASGTKVYIDKGTVLGDTPAVYTITEELAPKATASFEVTYQVAEADIRAGKIENEARAEGKVADNSYTGFVQTFLPNNAVAETSEKAIVTTTTPNPQIELKKDIVSITAADGSGKSVDGPVDIGDTITYTIVAKNAGNIALQNVVVEDELTGNTVENGNAFRIPLGFGPNAELRLDDNDTKAQYTVTEADIVAGRVTNMATVETSEITDLSGNPVILEDDDVSGGTKEIATQQQNPSLAMVIERAPVNPDDPDSLPDDSIVGLNDEVNYIIRVTNNGNVTIENIKVTDVLTRNVDGEELEIASLAPGETVELPVTYANVTEADILAGSIVNRASAVGTNKNDADEDTNKVTANAEHTAVTDAVSTAYTVTRTLTDPQAIYRVGETIRYTITITSQANVSLNNVVVSDLLDGTDGNVTYTGMTTTAADGTTTTADTIPVNTANEVTIDSLQPGSTVTLTCEYTVVRADAGTDNAIVGTTNVKADSIWTTGNDAEEMTVAAMTSTASPAPIENMYNLTIHYVYAAGGQAAPDVVAQYLEGETFTYTTPAIDGYTPDYGTVGSGETGMLARDVEVTVVYTANVINIPTTPTTPGGTPVTPGGTPVTPVIMGEPQVAPAVADAAAAAAPAAAAVTTVAAAAPDLVDVEDDEVPLAQPEDGQITEDENGDVDLVPIEDDEVPLANTVIDEHVFCILHYLLFLLTLILAVIYAISLQKQKKRLVILQKGYDEEMRNR